MTRSEPDALPDELLCDVGERYGLGLPITARRLTGGYANDVFRLDAVGAPSVLHLKHPPVDDDNPGDRTIPGCCSSRFRLCDSFRRRWHRGVSSSPVPGPS